MAETVSNESRDEDDLVAWTGAHLVRLLAAHSPTELPARHALVELSTVEIGRGERAGHRRDGERLRIDVADALASQDHARLTRTMGRWQIEDHGSKNGLLINGARVARTVLADGDVVELGRTFFAFVTELEWQRSAPPDAGPEESLPGVSTVVPWLAAPLAQAAMVARGGSPIVITGPTGSGKEVVARGVHAASGRSGAFVPVNCGAIPRELVESTMFGHRRGAFSGAVDDEPGLIRGADRGTLFLDEIGDLPLPAQAALLRVLQEREVTPVGASKPVPVDLRVVCATHRDLAAMTTAGGFRDNLLHRLRGFSLVLPGLAERRLDLGLLIATLLERHAGGRPIGFHPRAARALLAYGWPGSVRELEQVLIAALSLATEDTITSRHLPAPVAAAADAPTASIAADDPQRERLIALLVEHAGNVRAIARALGKDPAQIRRWLRRYRLDADTYRA